MSSMDKDEPEIIRLLDASGFLLLDSVATEYEDSFCLETFADSIKAAQESDPAGKKNFIIARVQTWDHKQPDRSFYSYYHAHHLNKLLFQTQIYNDKKLIHRLHVLNPLTNTDIIGNVLYFMVVGKSKKLSDGRYVKVVNGSQKRGSGDSAKIGRLDDAHKIDMPSGDSVHVGAGHVMAVPPSPSVAKLPPFSDPLVLNQAIHNRAGMAESIPEENEQEEEEVKSPLRSPTSKLAEGWTLSGPVSNEDTDAPLPSSSPSNRRQSLADHALSLGRTISNAARPSGFKQLDEESANGNSTAMTQFSPSSAKLKAKNPALLRGDLRVQTGGHVASPSGALSAGIAERKNVAPLGLKINIPASAHPNSEGSNLDGLLSPGSLMKMQMRIPAGVISLHGEQITPLQAMAMVPPSAKGRRRHLSFMNAVSTSGSSNASVSDWKKMYKKEKSVDAAEEEPLMQASGKYDQVKPFGSSQEKDEAEEYVYDAILLATDNDFLETSRVRAIFKENAVNQSDAVLFEMPPYNSNQAATNRGPMDLHDSPLPCDFCFPSEEALRQGPAWLRIVHECKCYLLLVVLTGALVVFVTLGITQGQTQP